jgi:hypothetical protein
VQDNLIERRIQMNQRYKKYVATLAIPCVGCSGNTKDRVYDLEEHREIAVCTTCVAKPPFTVKSTAIRSYAELPENASVEMFVAPDKKRYVRFLNGDETDKFPPSVVYAAPAWVWQLYQQGYTAGFEEDHSR